MNPQPSSATRINAIDTLRGLVMILMALDHVREYVSQTAFRPEDLTQTTAALFLSRWVTHFCAPVFVWLSGVSIFLHSARQPAGGLRDYLLSRGIFLVLLEVVVVSFLLQFGYNFVLLQVIWVIGWGMILLALLQGLPRQVLLVISLIVIAGHNLLPDVPAGEAANSWGAMVHNSPFVKVLGPIVIIFSYPLVPWVAVLWLGYAMGDVFLRKPEAVASWMRRAGWVTLVLFVSFRGLNIYGDPALWSVQDRGWIFTVLSFVNVTKYPPSLLFLMLTLGVAMLLLSVKIAWRGKVAQVLQVFGRVPMFYYLLHLLLIVGGALVWAWISFGQLTLIAFDPSRFPAGYESSLTRAFIAWALVVTVLYFPCRWYAGYKELHKPWWGRWI